MPNFGQKTLNLQGEHASFSSVFQIAAVTRPLMSVGRICDNGNKVLFEQYQATVLDKNNAEVCVFQRKPGGLYTSKLKLQAPFHRQD